MARIAFLGLGTMGRGMAANLVKAGHDVVVWNRSEGRTVAGSTVAATVGDAVADAEFVLYCFADDRAVSEVVLAEGGAAGLVPTSAVVIDLSTISPEVSDEEHAVYAGRGVRFLDAPVFGSKGEAEAGGLWIVVGGSEEDFAAARPVLEAVSETVHHLGPAGSGVRMKLVGNLVVASQLLALGQALTLAKKGGLDLEKVLEVLAVTDFKSPIFDGVGPSVLAGDYSPSFALALMQKDAGLIQAYADSVGAPVPGVRIARQYIDAAMDAGFGGENASALIKAVAAEAEVDLSQH